MSKMDCPNCRNDIPAELAYCPHCARPALFPNVRQAEQEVERNAVKERYEKALSNADNRECLEQAYEFESKISDESHAVIGRSIEEALRLAKADHEGYATFWSLLHAGVRFPNDDRWNRLRGLADYELFGAFRDHIRFAALSCEGACLKHYGKISLELKEDMIAHRATVFEENSAVFFKNQRRKGNEPPEIAGFRALWSDRGKLALSKHEKDLTPTSTAKDFASMLLRGGATSEDDVFVEVHIYGSLTRRSLKRILVAVEVEGAIVVDLCTRLEAINVQVETLEEER